MSDILSITVVIPTCNRTDSILRTLQSLSHTSNLFAEVIIVDSSDDDQLKDRLTELEIKTQYIRSEKSVCIQRNIGIQQAKTEWIFLCDDDIEVPPAYLPALVRHASRWPSVGALSGLVLQSDGAKWEEQYPITSMLALRWNSIFNLGIWGEVKANGALSQRYKKKGNHISKAGWPVVTDFSGDYFKTPVYGLGASLVKRDWLMQSPYDEILDRSGIGDNYGVAMGFPQEGIHVLTHVQVYHHRAAQNRVDESLSYFRRLLALDYFITIGRCKQHVTRGAYQWSLIGNFFSVIKSGQVKKALATAKAFVLIIFRRNPYVVGKQKNLKTVQPSL